jgi:hypothetical protein
MFSFNFTLIFEPTAGVVVTLLVMVLVVEVAATS